MSRSKGTPFPGFDFWTDPTPMTNWVRRQEARLKRKRRLDREWLAARRKVLGIMPRKKKNRDKTMISVALLNKDYARLQELLERRKILGQHDLNTAALVRSLILNALNKEGL